MLADIAQRLERVERDLDRLCEQTPPGDSKSHLSISDVSRVAAISDSHVRRAIRKGDLPASNVGTISRPLWRIARSDLDAWLEGKKGGTSTVPPRSTLQSLIDRHLPGLRGRRDSATR